MTKIISRKQYCEKVYVSGKEIAHQPLAFHESCNLIDRLIMFWGIELINHQSLFIKTMGIETKWLVM